MLTLLRGHGVAGYRVSPRIAHEPLISQRIVEGAWPIRPDGVAAGLWWSKNVRRITCLPGLTICPGL
jgi:hypothetical protein